MVNWIEMYVHTTHTHTILLTLGVKLETGCCSIINRLECFNEGHQNIFTSFFPFSSFIQVFRSVPLGSNFFFWLLGWSHRTRVNETKDSHLPFFLPINLFDSFTTHIFTIIHLCRSHNFFFSFSCFFSLTLIHHWKKNNLHD